MEEKQIKFKKEGHLLLLLFAFVLEACFLLILILFLDSRFERINQQILSLKNENFQYSEQELYSKEKKENDLTFASLPIGWELVYQDKNTVKLKTDFEEFDVYLIGKIESKKKEQNSNILTENKVVEMACGGIFACHELEMVSGEKYVFSWEIVSNEKAPEILDGIWSPKHNITQEQILSLLKEIKK
jgi:hypothetical protein